MITLTLFTVLASTTLANSDPPPAHPLEMNDDMFMAMTFKQKNAVIMFVNSTTAWQEQPYTAVFQQAADKYSRTPAGDFDTVMACLAIDIEKYNSKMDESLSNYFWGSMDLEGMELPMVVGVAARMFRPLFFKRADEIAGM